MLTATLIFLGLFVVVGLVVISDKSTRDKF
jgi:hypothetical protein